MPLAGCELRGCDGYQHSMRSGEFERLNVGGYTDETGHHDQMHPVTVGQGAPHTAQISHLRHWIVVQQAIDGVENHSLGASSSSKMFSHPFCTHHTHNRILHM